MAVCCGNQDEILSLAKQFLADDIEHAVTDYEEQNEWIDEHPGWHPKAGEAEYVDIANFEPFPLTRYYFDQAEQHLLSRANPKRWKLRSLQNGQAFEVIVEAASFTDAVETYRREHPDLTGQLIAFPMDTPSRVDYVALKKYLKELRSAHHDPESTFSLQPVGDSRPWLVRSRYRKPPTKLFPAGMILPNRPLVVYAHSRVFAVREFRHQAPFPFLTTQPIGAKRSHK